MLTIPVLEEAQTSSLSSHPSSISTYSPYARLIPPPPVLQILAHNGQEPIAYTRRKGPRHHFTLGPSSFRDTRCFLEFFGDDRRDRIRRRFFFGSFHLRDPRNWADRKSPLVAVLAKQLAERCSALFYLPSIPYTR